MLRGVVNGLYRLDEARTLEMLTKYAEEVPPEERESLSGRYVVRVGFNRNSAINSVMATAVGVWKSSARFSDHVLLPEGWRTDPFEVSADPYVVNVGDIVDVRVQGGRYYDYVESLVRQCSEEPAEDEHREWHIGCRTYKEFDSRGYAGQYYYFRAF